jgi:hypothetical protein
MTRQALETRVRVLLWFFIVALLLSGITAFPLEWELSVLNQWVNGFGSPLIACWPAMSAWIALVNEGFKTLRANILHSLRHRLAGFCAHRHRHCILGPLKDPGGNI